MGLNYPVDLEAWHAWQQRQKHSALGERTRAEYGARPQR